MTPRPDAPPPSSDLPITMVLHNPDGSEEQVTLQGAGGTARVAVGEPGHSSLVWRIWANPNAPDVYVMIRTARGEQKWSLHWSGEFYEGWTSNEIAVKYTGSPKRFRDAWKRPEPDEAGVTRGLVIVVPHGELTNIAFEPKTLKDVNWIPEALPGLAVAIFVTIARAGDVEVPLEGAQLLHAIRLSSGEVLLVVAALTELDDELRANLDRARITAHEVRQASGVSLTAQDRATVHATGGAGDRRVYDLAAIAP